MAWAFRCTLAEDCANGGWASNIRRLVALGLEVHITEMDVRLPVPASPGDLQAQSRIYGTVARTCVLTPGCKALLTWGVNDAHSWIPDFYPGLGAALLFDRESHPNPARQAVQVALR
jgi:endo-1,4-beta-xylanase